MTTHNLKIEPEYFAAVDSGQKTFEIRLNDRGFEVGHRLNLKEYIPGTHVENGYWVGSYTGREAMFEITYITDFQQQPGYVVMSIKGAS